MKGNIEKIYGVNLVGSQDPNALIRVDDAVGLNITVGTSEITSDFDSCYPWSDIEEVTDKFGNVFVKIPKFYSKITKNSDGTYKHQLSGTKHDGFDTLFKVGTKEIDYVMVGKYEGGGSSLKVCSKSGQTPLVNTTMDQFRNGCKANGAGYQQYDFLIDLIIKELWLVEMKTTNCQSIMYGYVVGNQFKGITGTTDSVSTPSGSPVSNTDGRHACKYRGIENPWGNVWKWCDGISFNNNSVYICTEPNFYEAAKVTVPYVYYGTCPSDSGYVKTVAPLAEGSLVQYVTAVGGDRNTYYCDSSYKGGTVLACGGGWSNGGVAGLWCWHGNVSASLSHPDFCGRLCYKPVASFNPLRNRLNCMVKSNSTMLNCVGLPMFPLATTTTEAFYLQPASWTEGSETGDLTKYGNTELEYLNYPHPFDTLTGEKMEYDNIDEHINTKNPRTIGECCLQPIATFGWQPQTWTGLTDFNGHNVWTDGTRAYYSSPSKQYQLKPYTSVWVPKKWQGPLNYFDLDGKNIWSDGSTIYYSASVEEQYELVPNTSTWILKTWKGFTPLQGENIWTDGTNIYYSTKTKVNYQLDKTTSTWNKKTWGGLLTDFEGKNVWTDGENIYYSYGNFQYQLDLSTSTWKQKTWSGTKPEATSIWTDGTNIYSSAGQHQYQLDKATSTWNPKTWTELTSFDGFNVWTVNGNVYYSEGDKQYQLQVPKTNQYNVWTDLKRVQVVTPAGPRVVQTNEPAKWDDTKYWVEGWDAETDTHMVQVKRHPQLTNKTLKIDCYMKNIDELYTGLETCTLSYEDDPKNNSGTWYLKKPDGSTYITLKVTQTQKQEGQS